MELWTHWVLNVSLVNECVGEVVSPFSEERVPQLSTLYYTSIYPATWIRVSDGGEHQEACTCCPPNDKGEKSASLSLCVVLEFYKPCDFQGGLNVLVWVTPEPVLTGYLHTYNFSIFHETEIRQDCHLVFPMCPGVHGWKWLRGFWGLGPCLVGMMAAID